MKKIYLDYAATTPTDREVLEEMLPYFSETYGNPSSFHSFGQLARRGIEHARRTVALMIGADPEEVVFTSGGTESNNHAIKGIAYKNRKKGNHIITSSIEHHAVINPCKFLEKQGFRVTYLPVDRSGLMDPEDVRSSITRETILISIMHGNNEIGTIEPIEEIGEIARERDIYFHTDAVQTFGHLPINVNQLPIDLLSASAHKLYGPKGVGFIYIRKGTKVTSFMHGGGQENGRRASTCNTPGIVGLGKATEIAWKVMEEEGIKLTRLRDKLIKGILESIEDTQLNGHPIMRLPNNINVTVKYIEGESMLLSLDIAGIACSTGSACSSTSLEPSHVLLAIGQDYEIAHGSLRFTLGRYTEEEDIDYVLEVLPRIVARLRSISPLYAAVKK